MIRVAHLTNVGYVVAAVLSFGVLRPAVVSAQSASNTGVVSGFVLTDPGDRPIPNATVRVSGATGSAVSDSAGKFTLNGVPGGMQRFEVIAVGYKPLRQSIVVSAGQTIEVDLLMVADAQQLAGVKVAAAGGEGVRTPWKAGFDERKGYGIGTFITTADLERQDASRWASVVAQRVPGINLVTYNGRASFAISRGPISDRNTPKGDIVDAAQGAPKGCYAQVIIDDIVRYASRMGEPLFDVTSIDPNTVAAVEYYSVAQLPARFNRGGNAPCGVLVIWRK